MTEIEQQLQRVREWFAQHPRVIIAFSGGVDSCLVSFLARRFLDRASAVAIISNSASLKASDLEVARDFSERYDILLREVDAREIDDPNYRSNPIDRCFHCKTALYTTLQQLRDAEYPGFELLNGNNLSDQGDYRPGMIAARDNAVFSPLLECGFNKDAIRILAKHFDLVTWDKPASPCLSSRFRYGVAITEPQLRQVEDAEAYLEQLGFSESRVRVGEEQVTVEVPRDEVERLSAQWPSVKAKLVSLGLRNPELDAEGFVSGKLNRGLIHG